MFVSSRLPAWLLVVFTVICQGRVKFRRIQSANSTSNLHDNVAAVPQEIETRMTAALSAEMQRSHARYTQVLVGKAGLL